MTLHIDIETFSSVDIKSAGVYKYVESPDFEMLLIAYTLCEGFRVESGVIDMTDQEADPVEYLAIIDYLKNPAIIKKAWNANFERTALAKWAGVEMPPEQWQCTMIQAARCSLPLGLDACSRALGVEEKQKDGKALIRYFCTPCKPTKANGGRTRNLPHHDPEKWERFKRYCMQDVIVEMQIDEKARFYPTSDFEHALWNLDQRINDRGIQIDPLLVNKAIELDHTYRNKLVAEAKRISNLDNPNSVAQLIEWLSTEMDEEVTTLKKDNIPVLLDRAKTDSVTRILEIRQLMGKTSVKKYKAMEKSVCADGYIRGLFQFYGANRTGRWAGRLVQVQNLPGAKLKDLATARDLVKAGDLETLEMLYENVPDLLSQLIRTAFIGPFDVADFSAIEARVIAWLAGEQWRIEVFKTHGKIYEASASQMFGIPIDQVDKKLRQKGKIAELALGYQGGVDALIQMGALKMGLEESELQPIVTAWRAANRKIRQLWYDMQKAATAALENTGEVHKAGVVEFRTKGGHLMMKLPSGRFLVYWNAHLEPGEYGQQIKYYGMDQTTKKWGRQTTYGGKLVENATQAIARDLLAESMLRLDSEGYNIRLHVHDEIGADKKDYKKMAEIMGRDIDWAVGLPLKAEAYETFFYRKD